MLLPLLILAQLAQNPSPMVEHTRPHTRLTEQEVSGRRYTLSLGKLFVPPKLGRPRTLLVFFHGGTWVPELAGSRRRMAVLSIQVGAGSSTYANAFSDAHRFGGLLGEAEEHAGMHFDRVILGGWSAGCGAIRQILRSPADYARTYGVVCIDGVHAGYPTGKPGPLESTIEPADLDSWLRLTRDAAAGHKRAVITHSEIFPGTFASTTETADYLISQLHLRLRPVLKQGPMGSQQISETRAGKLLIMGFAGNSAPDHVDQLHSLPELLKLIK